MNRFAQISEIQITHYSKTAKSFDFAVHLYYLLGYRLKIYRRRAVDALNLKPGDTVVDMGCGTGLNFPLLQQAAGESRRIIGVDITEAMLAQARKRIRKHTWRNLELVKCDGVDFQFPAGVNGIISTFALGLIPGFETIIANGARALSPGGRWVVLELKVPSDWLGNLLPLFMPIIEHIGVPKKLIEERPWEIVRETFEANLENVSIEEFYLGTTYLISGESKGGK
ncbi:MAG: class I SAM-dependent methyltransferase [Calditrichia bacterium]